nr:MAG TPA: hypothetical protein [Caudoviricetes sp.]
MLVGSIALPVRTGIFNSAILPALSPFLYPLNDAVIENIFLNCLGNAIGTSIVFRLLPKNCVQPA